MTEVREQFNQYHKRMTNALNDLNEDHLRDFPQLPNEEDFFRSSDTATKLNKVKKGMDEAKLDPIVIPVPDFTFEEWQTLFGKVGEQECIQARSKVRRKLGKTAGSQAAKELLKEQNRWRIAVISKKVIGIYLGDDSMQADEYNRIHRATGIIGTNVREQLAQATPSINTYLAAQLLERRPPCKLNPQMMGEVLLRNRQSTGKPLRFKADSNDQLLLGKSSPQIKIDTFTQRNASLGIMLGVEFEP